MLKKRKININGQIPSDSSFSIFKRYKYNVIIGMYHDKVLTPFKALYNYKAINITLDLPYIRISPDHGVAHNIIGKKSIDIKITFFMIFSPLEIYSLQNQFKTNYKFPFNAFIISVAIAPNIIPPTNAIRVTFVSLSIFKFKNN